MPTLTLGLKTKQKDRSTNTTESIYFHSFVLGFFWALMETDYKECK